MVSLSLKTIHTLSLGAGGLRSRVKRTAGKGCLGMLLGYKIWSFFQWLLLDTTALGARLQTTDSVGQGNRRARIGAAIPWPWLSGW